MNTPLLLALLSLALVTSFVFAFRMQRRQLRSLEDFKLLWRPLDLESFANLLDPGEENFLRDKLSAREFRRIHRERLFVTLEYLGRISTNTRLMVQAGQIIQHHNSGEEALRARQHVQRAMQLRMIVFSAQCALYTKLLLPQMKTPVQTVLHKYGMIAHSFDNVLDARGLSVM